MRIKPNTPVLYDAHNNPIPLSRARRKARGQARALLSARGFKSTGDENLMDWAFLPLDINTILRNDLRRLRAQCRDLARNDDTTKRFLFLLKQNVLGHMGIKLQAKNKLPDKNNSKTNRPDTKFNDEIEREWGLFGRKRRRRGQFESPSACGKMTLREIAWLALLSRAIDGECFIQILRGYPHNRHRFAIRFLNPDLLDSSYCIEQPNGNRVEMGIELDEFDRPVAYHFNQEHPNRKYLKSNAKRLRIPADQIIHIYRHEYVGQLRGIPDFAGIIHKTKMLNGVHEAIVVGWRVAAAKMGFFVASDPEFSWNDKDDDEGREGSGFAGNSMDATPGSFDLIPEGFDLRTFDPDYPTSTYESGHRVFMQQLSNGLNVSSPTLSNDYAKVNYSSLRQALLEDREGWRCIQAEMIDGFYQPLFDDWYEWTRDIVGLFKLARAKLLQEPTIVWQPRGWPWVDPLKEVNAQVAAVRANFRTRQSVMAETTGADFTDTADALAEEQTALEERGLSINLETNNDPSKNEVNDDD